MGGTRGCHWDGIIFPSERPQGLGTCWARFDTELQSCAMFTARVLPHQGVPFTWHLLAVISIISQVYESPFI